MSLHLLSMASTPSNLKGCSVNLTCKGQVTSHCEYISACEDSCVRSFGQNLLCQAKITIRDGSFLATLLLGIAKWVSWLVIWSVNLWPGKEEIRRIVQLFCSVSGEQFSALIYWLGKCVYGLSFCLTCTVGNYATTATSLSDLHQHSMGTKTKGLSMVYFHHNANCTTVGMRRRVRNKPRKGNVSILSHSYFFLIHFFFKKCM